MPQTKPLKETYLWRPSDAAWRQLEAKADKDRRPINQVLNDIVIDYFTPKLFDNVLPVRPTPKNRTPMAKTSKAGKKAKTKV